MSTSADQLPTQKGLLGTLQSLGVQALGLAPELHANACARQQLFTQAGFHRETASQYKGPHDAQLLANLNAALDEISRFEKEVGKRGPTAGLNAALDRQRVEEYGKRLELAWSRFHADITVRQKPQVTWSSAPFPVDQILPILPKPVPDYVGHQEELKGHLTLIRDNPSAHTIILGAGGIGKTAMATRLMYDESVESEFGNLRFFIDCNGIISADGIVAALASVFNVTQCEGSALQQALLQYIRSLRTRVLVVFDNLESAWLTDDQRTVETFLSHICYIDLIAVVVTMRGTSPPDGPVWHRITDLEPLAMQDAYSLFTKLCQKTAAVSDESDLNDLLGLLDGLPLAITLLASVRLTAKYTPSELLAAYRSESTAMATRGLGNDPHTSLDVSISLSINCRTMKDNPEALSLLALLSLLPDGLRDEDSASAVSTIKSYRKAARVLVQVALCTRHEESYRVLAPIRAYIQIHHPPDELHLKKLRHYHFQLALRGYDCHKEPFAVLAEVGSRTNNLQAVLMHALGTGSRADAGDILGAILGLSYFSYIMSTGDSKPYLQAALAVYWNNGNSEGASRLIRTLLAKCVHRLGDVMRMQGDFHGATVALEEAKAAFQHVRDRLGAARCTQSLSNVMRIRGDYDGATVALEEAKAAFQDIGHRLGAAQCTQSLGDLMRRQGDYDGGMAALEEAKGVFQDIGNRLGAAACIQSLGNFMRMRGDYDRAMVTLEEAKTAFKEIGHRVGAAQCTQSLGNLMRGQGDYEGGTAALEEAKRLFQDMGDRLGAVECTRSLAQVMHLRGDYHGATVALEEAKAAFDDIGHCQAAAQCRQTLGNLMCRRGDYDSATAALEEAMLAFQDIGDRLGAAHCTLNLGDVMHVRGDYDGATAALEGAKTAFQDIGDRLREARCMQSLGDVMAGRGDYDGATMVLEEAKVAFRDMGHRLGAVQCMRSLGQIMGRRGDYERATVALKESNAVFQDIGDRLGAAQCMLNLGDVMRVRGDYDGATAALEEAKAVFKDAGDRLGAAQCTKDLGDVMHGRGDYDGATAALEEAKAVFEDIGHRLGAAQCMLSLGSVACTRGTYEGAIAVLGEAKAVFEDNKLRLGAAKCTQSLGYIMFIRGDYDGATAALEEAKAAFQDIGDSLGVAQCMQTLYEIGE